MDPNRYLDHTYGKPVTNPMLDWSYPYFDPKPIPREIALRPETNDAVARASLALGRLDGLGTLINEPDLLLGPSMVQEAVASSRIEGTQASLSDVLSADEDEPIESEDLREVANYLAASRRGTELLQELPITGRFICELHKLLLAGVRGEVKHPGEYRTSPVWIGAADATPRTATFIPPHNTVLAEALSDWEKYVNAGSLASPVVKSALLHYQFETIHPFLEGNGRMGRLLIGFALMQYDALHWPILHISGYFENNRSEYYERLQNVRERGEMDEWIQFFSAAVTSQSELSGHRIRDLVQLRERYRSEVAKDRSAITGLIDVVFGNPYLTVRRVMKELNLSQPGASGIIRKAENRGWLRSTGRRGRGGRESWLATEVWAALTRDYEEK